MILCAYCNLAPAIHRDHIVSKADRRRYAIEKNEETLIVPSCFTCNLTKLTMRLVPQSHAHLIPWLNHRMAGPRWQVWHGGKIPDVKRT